MLVDLQKIFSLFLFSLLLQEGYSENAPRFSHLTVEDGLSNSSVLSTFQDYKGFIWLGTRDGLNRYDGKRITIYRDFYKNNPKGPNVKINCIAEDKLQNLWIGTNNGLYIYNPVED
ncbi:MAG TPA: two-component regulator propeller domain-containing protein, partial [Niabella sp.]|nr:two-component regulator propeller domain-containing protein [Niabella sp.]